MSNDWWMETVKTSFPTGLSETGASTLPATGSSSAPLKSSPDLLLETVAIHGRMVETQPMPASNHEDKLGILDAIFPLSERKAFLAHDPPLLCFETGQPVIRKGEKHRILYLLVQGELSVRRPELSTPLATIEPGQFFGEMSFFIPAPRYTDVVAEKRSLVFKLDPTLFDALPLTVRDKIKDQLIATLVKRLADMNDSLVKIARFAQTHTM